MKRLSFTNIIFCLLVTILYACNVPEKQNPVYMATGIKIGEVTQHEAIVWVRLTENPEPVGKEAPMPNVKYKDPESGQLIERRGRPDKTPVVTFPGGSDINTIQGAAPGTPGRARLQYRIEGTNSWMVTEWEDVNPEHDFTHQFALESLKPGQIYDLLVEAAPPESEEVTAKVEGKFKTAPAPSQSAPVSFIVTTGTSFGDIDSEQGYQLYPSALQLDPEFFVHTGDILYYDGMGKTLELARWHWDRMYSQPNHVDFHRQVSSYFIKDDHDTWMNDAYPGMETKFMGEFTYEQGTQLFLEEVPMGEKTYRTVRWGKDLQIWLVEGRDYRSPNPMPDEPGKTIWGQEQMDWFMSTVENSDATYKILFSPTPIVGPDRDKKNDNHANEGFTYEGNKIRNFISQQENMVIVCGDRHWQYVSKDDETGILEFSCGPGSDAHAGGWSQDDKRPEHIYLNVTGGFLEGSLETSSAGPKLVFRHYNPKGTLLNEHEVE